jgi:hypothetical protein
MSQPQIVIYGNGDLLLRSQVPLSRLNRRMPKQKLDLFQIAAVLATEASRRSGADHVRRSVQFLFASMTVELPTRSLLLSNYLAHFCAHYSPHRLGIRGEKGVGMVHPKEI